MTDTVIKINKCRVCKSAKLIKVLSFNSTPLANAFLTKKQLDNAEYYYPLDVLFCKSCSFLQLGHVVSPKILFKDYVYASSTSAVFVNHFKEFAKSVSKRFMKNKNSLIVDIGSNDGILLLPFKSLGFKVLGVEPATTVAKIAKKKGIETMEEFFSANIAKKILKKGGEAKIITATNVFAHIDNLDEVIKEVKILLDQNGIFIIEAPYLVDFLQKGYFDLVYHEHLSYWSVNSLVKLFKRHDLEVFDVEKVPVHGGSIRVFVKKVNLDFTISKNVTKFLKLEKEMKLNLPITYNKFMKKVERNRHLLQTLLYKIKLSEKNIAGYGAPAKGNTLLNYFNIGTETIDYIVDDSPLKQGLFTPGKHIPVVSSKALDKNRPDYLLILAWNFADAIMKNNIKYKESGGKFIIPVPKPVVI